jgi:hypothetical protein
MPGLSFDMWVPLMMTPQLTGADERIFSDGSRNYWRSSRATSPPAAPYK